MKKSKYVTKYDYIGYYCLQPNFWFFTNAEILAAINANINLLNGNKNEIDQDIDDEENESNLYDQYKEYKLIESVNPVLLTSDDKYLNIYLHELQNTTNIDNNNPLMIEGNIIDKKSKDYVLSQYNKDQDFVIYDFDLNKDNLENQALKTKELIHKNKKIIIFQPVFIDLTRKIATKCDALIKEYDEIKIIETKGTTTSKFTHFLDIYYQKKLLENIDYITNYSIDFYLCLLSYEYAKKNEITFIISDTINLKKTISTSKTDSIYQKQLKKIGIYKNDEEDYSCYINDVLSCQDYEQWISNLKVSKIPNESEFIISVLKNFDTVIDELWEQKNKLTNQSYIGIISLNKNDVPVLTKNPFKSELFYLYSLQSNIFKFSGSIYRLNNNNINSLIEHNYWKNIKISEIKKYKWGDNINYFDDFRPYIINKSLLSSHLNALKSNIVYFDFETINTAFRVIDNSLPFMQIVTQVSIIKKNKNDTFSNLLCNNMMIDPKKININWFKEIINNLYMGNEYSYVVYNKGFEKTRLEEMANIINENEYYNKVNIINNNIYDFADFFTINKKMFFLPELYGYYSIKKVLPLIEKYSNDSFLTVKCVNYKTLNIYNGLICQNKTKLRFLGYVDDDEWKQVVDDSKKYCENDVRAMIAVELFVKNYLLKKLNYEDNNN